MAESPVVSVIINTYNHGKYIVQAIESALMQETSFPFEIIIGEDESNDGTREICMTYAQKYPDKIRLFLRSRKDVIYVNGKPTGRFNFIENVKMARGRYIALLPGDDYWVGQQRLEKQVRYMEEHPDCAITCGHATILDGNDEEKEKKRLPDREHFEITDLARGNIIYTASAVYRTYHIREAISMPDFLDALAGDYFIAMIGLSHGSLHYFREVFVARRIHPGGIWASKPIANQLFDILHCQYLILKNIRRNENACTVLRDTLVSGFSDFFSRTDFDVPAALEKFDDQQFKDTVMLLYGLHKHTENRMRRHFEQFLMKKSMRFRLKQAVRKLFSKG